MFMSMVDLSLGNSRNLELCRWWYFKLSVEDNTCVCFSSYPLGPEIDTTRVRSKADYDEIGVEENRLF